MPQETKFLRQPAVLWPAAGADRYGQTTVGDPVEVRVRWDDVSRQVLDPHGNSISIDAEVVASRDIAIGSQMWLGTLAQWYGTGTSSGSANAQGRLCEVKGEDVVPDVKNRARTRCYYLMRMREKE